MYSLSGAEASAWRIVAALLKISTIHQYQISAGTEMHNRTESTDQCEAEMEEPKWKLNPKP